MENKLNINIDDLFTFEEAAGTFQKPKEGNKISSFNDSSVQIKPNSTDRKEFLQPLDLQMSSSDWARFKQIGLAFNCLFLKSGGNEKAANN